MMIETIKNLPLDKTVASNPPHQITTTTGMPDLLISEATNPDLRNDYVF